MGRAPGAGRCALHAAYQPLKERWHAAGSSPCPAGLGRANSIAEGVACGGFACSLSLPLPHSVSKGDGQSAGRCALHAACQPLKQRWRAAGSSPCPAGLGRAILNAGADGGDSACSLSLPIPQGVAKGRGQSAGHGALHAACKLLKQRLRAAGSSPCQVGPGRALLNAGGADGGGLACSLSLPLPQVWPRAGGRVLGTAHRTRPANR
jgi:hypothetical protein